MLRSSEKEVGELRAENERLKAELREEKSLLSTTMVERLRADNERLRALLSEVVNYFQGGIMPLDLHDWRERASKAAAADQPIIENEHDVIRRAADQGKR